MPNIKNTYMTLEKISKFIGKSRTYVHARCKEILQPKAKSVHRVSEVRLSNRNTLSIEKMSRHTLTL